MALNTEGGPNWVGNTVDATVLVNATADEFYKQPTFYALAHFSKFVRPGARFVETRNKLNGAFWSFDYSAFVSNDSSRVVVLHNADATLPFKVRIVDAASPSQGLDVDLQPSSFVTIIYQLDQDTSTSLTSFNSTATLSIDSSTTSSPGSLLHGCILLFTLPFVLSFWNLS